MDYYYYYYYLIRSKGPKVCAGCLPPALGRARTRTSAEKNTHIQSSSLSPSLFLSITRYPHPSYCPLTASIFFSLFNGIRIPPLRPCPSPPPSSFARSYTLASDTGMRLLWRAPPPGVGISGSRNYINFFLFFLLLHDTVSFHVKGISFFWHGLFRSGWSASKRNYYYNKNV